MTSIPNTPETDRTESQEPQQATTTSEAATGSTFTFNPFAPATYAPKQGDGQPWHQRNNKSNHDKRPHTPPRGTRRSMGKR
ncbi:hypothetical protein [Pseudomonas oryzae]|uniref:Uncharacterized protein n=1 Tax=Pseudomonas oryzae TaxID=1392877 RepID=A0A1H1TVD7_9PSED|nr:hypothetical protein [Pseudomonas oryzae]SDS64168.1 hypothetical protein SAMN05216221_2272 [Pseudomonas oryzae]